tara:strand:- start:18646 stop:19038 length:393 start_codon:yes stop_codon:yes gene_type:complete
MEISTAAQNASGQAITDLLNSGTIEIRTGASPGVNNAATGTLLATLTLGNPAFGAWANGSSSANAITGDTSADATGTAGYFRAISSGSAAVIDGTVSATGGSGELQLNSVSITQGVPVDVTAWTITKPAS